MAEIVLGGGEIERLVAQIESLTDGRERAIIYRAVAEKVAVVAQSMVSDPPPAEHRPLPRFYERVSKVTGETYLSKFKTQRQQGYFFGVLLPEGQVPYVRGRGTSEQLTAQLGALPYDITVADGNVTITLGVDVSYGPEVVGGKDEQSHYHAGYWTPLREDLYAPKAVMKYEATVKAEFTSIVEQLLADGRRAG